MIKRSYSTTYVIDPLSDTYVWEYKRSGEKMHTSTSCFYILLLDLTTNHDTTMMT